MVAVETRDVTFPPPFWLHDASITVRVLDSLVELGVFAALDDRPQRVDDLAAALGLERRPLELALDVASRTAVVHRTPDERWVLRDPAALEMTIPREALSTLLRGRGPMRDVSDADVSDETYTRVAQRIGWMASLLQDELIPALRDPGQHVLELAAGSSPWGRALCADDPTTTVTAVDLPHVIDTTRAVVAHDGHDERYEFVTGDVFDVDLDRTADLVLLAAFCRLVGPDRNEALFARAAEWCAPGGRIAVIDAVATDRARADGISGYELGLLTRTSTGRCWTLDHYARWLTAAGFGHLDLVPTSRPEMTLVTAERLED
ncbi:SAM-dependent methyltransferase [Actinospongicola halichondriae]|uniref:SAM-dependent methyltransferase n=1 Tax=Actinospongicola halichondriae TaxID=3236844 RepID=UPI003D4D8FF0